MVGSDNAYKLIKYFEGCRLKAYKCSAGIWTIGYGNTYYEDGNRVKEGDMITMDRANELLKLMVKKFEYGINSLVKVSLSQNQFDALLSLTYNIGLANFTRSTLLSKINLSLPAGDEFMRWTKAKGIVIDGLVRRRKVERILYNTGVLIL